MCTCVCVRACVCPDSAGPAGLFQGIAKGFPMTRSGRGGGSVLPIFMASDLLGLRIGDGFHDYILASIVSCALCLVYLPLAIVKSACTQRTVAMVCTCQCTQLISVASQLALNTLVHCSCNFTIR